MSWRKKEEQGSPGVRKEDKVVLEEASGIGHLSWMKE
jgi:hypothetical protein